MKQNISLENLSPQDVIQVFEPIADLVEMERQKAEIKSGKVQTKEEMVKGFYMDNAMKMFDRHVRRNKSLLQAKLVIFLINDFFP
jgi:hypothetical protein